MLADGVEVGALLPLSSLWMPLTAAFRVSATWSSASFFFASLLARSRSRFVLGLLLEPA